MPDPPQQVLGPIGPALVSRRHAGQGRTKEPGLTICVTAPPTADSDPECHGRSLAWQILQRPPVTTVARSGNRPAGGTSRLCRSDCLHDPMVFLLLQPFESQ